MSENIETWLESLIEESEKQWMYQKCMQENEIPWDGYFQSFVEKSELTGSGLLLTGPDGCGKHTAAACMLKCLDDKGYEILFLSDLWLGRSGANEALDKIRGLLERFFEEETALCLVIEDLEEYPFRREVLSLLGRKLRDCYLDELPVFLILIDRDERSVPSLLRGRLQLCRMSLPNLDQRTQLIQQYSFDINNRLSGDYLAQVTEGLTYAQLRDLIKITCRMMDSMQVATSLSNEQVLEFCQTQMPQLAQEDAMPTIATSLQKLVEKLPEVLKPRPVDPVPNPASNPALNPKPTPNQVEVIKQEEERIRKLPPKSLATELFGEEGVKKMLEKAAEQENALLS